MNPPILRLYAVLVVLFGALVAFTSNWAVFDADALRERQDNRRALIEEQGIRRGTIRALDGEAIAESFNEGGARQPVFVRRYPTGPLFGHPVGYSFVELGNSGIERSENDVLIGRDSEFQTILDELRDVPEEGNDLTVTLDSEAQRVATEQLGGRRGAVVALEPDSGAVRAMVSVPQYDPNGIPDTFKRLNRDPDSPLFNRATQSGYAPGSTMKVVTAVAALDSGEFDPGTVLNGNSGVQISGVPLQNFGGEDFGEVDMTTALTNSVNTYWAQVGEALGPQTYLRYMDRFGFNARPPLDYPPDQMRVSGIYEGDELLSGSDEIDTGRVAIGQERLAVTPLQMAMVAAAVANDGRLMDPTFLQAVTDPDGRTTRELDPDVESTVMSEETAAQVTEMMTRVTQEGTAAGLSVDGVTFAGKTGTAEHGAPTEDCALANQAWFIGFAPADDPEIAVAATVECTSETGGEVAGPIATAVMESLLR